MLDAAELLRADKDIRIVIAGDGAAREMLEKDVASGSLTNLSMLPLQFGSDYKELLVDADVSLITQQSGSGNAFFPSKLLITLASFEPGRTVADEESALARAVAEGRFGKKYLAGKSRVAGETLARSYARSTATAPTGARPGEVMSNDSSSAACWRSLSLS